MRSFLLSLFSAVMVFTVAFVRFSAPDNFSFSVDAVADAFSASPAVITPAATPADTAAPEPVTERTPTPLPQSETVTVNIDGKLTPMDTEDYVLCVVAGEISPTSEPEALKAQAVAARTYLYYKKAHGGCAHGGDICTASSHCQAFQSKEKMLARWGEHYEDYYEALQQAVRETEGEIITYEGEPICALYHASSNGATEDCVAVFGNNLPYLVSVETNDEICDAKLNTTLSLTRQELTDKLQAAFPSLKITEGSIKVTDHTASGRVKTVTVDGQSVKATELRKALKLRSTDFSVSQANGRTVFSIHGYGHGIGMSQNGAEAMALVGAAYDEILLHYYTGVRLSII